MIPYIEVPDLQVFGASFHPFGFLVALGVLWSHHIVAKRARVLGLGPPAQVDLFVVVVFVGGFVGAHVFDTVFYHPEALRAGGWRELIMVHHGLSSFGGLLGALLGGHLFVHLKRWDHWVFQDLCTYGFPFGWLFGRLGCAVVHDHPGRLSSSPFAVAFPGGARFDLGLLELAFVPALIALVTSVAKRSDRPGVIAGAFWIAYALLRFPLDFLRATDLGADSDPRYLGLTPAQYGCVLSVALGAWAIRGARHRAPYRRPCEAEARG